MIQPTKITLSAKELELVCNAEWILTKHTIIDKVYRLFGDMAELMKRFTEEFQAELPGAILNGNAKISKGENYRLLPYVMLDYPRHFTKESTLAVRTFFWWGNFFSINLHLSGTHKQDALPALYSAFHYLQQHDYWLCINAEPWQHHFNNDNYVPVKSLSAEEFSLVLSRTTFLKIAKKISLEQWDMAAPFIEYNFKEIIALIYLNFQGDEKDLSPGIPKAGFDL